MRISPEEARFYIARLAILGAKTAPLLLGPPGVGKSVTSLEATYLVAKLYTRIALNRLDGKGKIDVSNLDKRVEMTLKGVIAQLKRYVNSIPPVYRDGPIIAAAEFLKRLEGIGDEEIALEEYERKILKVEEEGTSEEENATGPELFELLKSLALKKIKETNEDALIDMKRKKVAERMRSLNANLIERLIDTFNIHGDRKTKLAEVINISRRIVAQSAVRAALIEMIYGVKSRGILLYYDSQVPEVLYENAIVFVNFNVSSMTESDLTGIPSISYGGATTLWPKWALAAKLAHFAIINLDEVTNKMPDVMKSALYNIVLNKQTGTFHFGKFVVGTGNTIRTSSLVGTLPGPLFTGRFSQYLITANDLEDWKAYMDRTYRNKWHRGVYAVLKALRSLKNMSDKFRVVINKVTAPFSDPFILTDSEYAQVSKIKPGETPSFPSPRAWTAISLYLYRAGDVVEPSEVESYVIATVGMVGVARILGALMRRTAEGSSDLIRDEVRAARRTIALLDSSDDKEFARALGELIGLAYLTVLAYRNKMKDAPVEEVEHSMLNDLAVRARGDQMVRDLIDLIHKAILY